MISPQRARDPHVLGPRGEKTPVPLLSYLETYKRTSVNTNPPHFPTPFHISIPQILIKYFLISLFVLNCIILLKISSVSPFPLTLIRSPPNLLQTQQGQTNCKQSIKSNDEETRE